MIETIISALVYSDPFANVFNPWRDYDPLDVADCGPWARRQRLRFHFDCDPLFLLVGEAPGYQGCHYSGVPFTNEALICKGAVPRMGSQDRFTSRTRPWSEPSATIVWGTLHKLGIADRVVMWNAFAWHPHKPDDHWSNRAPSREELTAGISVLELVVNHFRYAPVVPIGRVAECTLKHLGVKALESVRHPGMGGANEFRAQLTALVQKHG